MTPDATVSLTLADETGTTPNTDNRTFTATGLTNGTTYRITLVNLDALCLTASGQVGFISDPDPASSTGFSAATGADIADISSVNNIATAATPTPSRPSR